MDVIPLGPGFAAELRGVTLMDVASDDAAYAAARAALPGNAWWPGAWPSEACASSN